MNHFWGWPEGGPKEERLAHLQLAVLRRVVQGAPAPAVADHLAPVQQQPAKHLGVAPAGSKVHGRRPVVVTLR